MDAGSFCIQEPGVELGSFAGRCAIDNDASEIAKTLHTLCYVLASQHFEDRVDALSAGEIFDRIHVIRLLVVDAVL